MTEAIIQPQAALDPLTEAPISKKEVCARIGISERTLDKLIVKDKAFPDGVSMGKQKFWLPVVVERYKASLFQMQSQWHPEPPKEGTLEALDGGQPFGYLSH